jgi:NitT/TauT family transport system substrate-binding protein
VGVTFGGPFLKNHPETATNLVAALIRGARDIQGDAYFAPENLQAYAEYTATPIDTLKSMDPYAFDRNLTPDQNTLLDMQRVFIAEGVLSQPQPIPTEQIVDPTLVQRAVAQLGP